MVTKADVSKLMAKGLTGQEAAKLILEDSWEVDHGRPGFLSAADIKRIQAGLKTQADIGEYNRLIHVYRLVDYSLKDAHIEALEAIRLLLLASKDLEAYWMEDRLKGIQLVLPAIVTEKQYEELKAKQRESELARVWPLAGVLEEVIQQRWPDLWNEYENSEIVDIEDFLRQEHPEAFQELLQELISSIQTGKLQPVLLQPAKIAAIQNIEEEIERLRERHLHDTGPWPPEFDKLQDQKEQAIQAGYDAGKPSAGQRQAKLIKLLEKQAAGSLTEEERDQLYYVYCSGAELYQLGINTRWVDEYHPNMDEETSARPAGMMQSFSVAIIQEPRPEQLDERGYYKEPRLLEKLSGYNRLQTLEERAGIPAEEMLKALHRNASEHIKVFLAIQASIEAVSKLVGVKLTEDLDSWYEDIETNVTLFNALVEPGRRPPHYLGMPKLEKLKIGRLKPTARSLRYYRERMAIALGEDWLKQAFETLEFRPSEPDSLADDAIKDILKVYGRSIDEEERDGQA
jgi:hypothetical protein